MNSSLRIAIPGTTVIHRVDPRVKVVLLLVFSVAVFFVDTWRGLGLAALFVCACIAAGKLPCGKLAKLSIPLLLLLAFIWVFNAFVLDVGTVAPSSLSGVSAGFAQGWQPVALAGTFGFNPEGCMFALFYAVRILLILLASFVVTFTTTAEELTSGFLALLRPLRAARVPVDDVATAFSIALRFIPLTAEELTRVRAAQVSRGAGLEEGSAVARVLGWRVVFIPLVVGLFRRADALGCAMQARCYGAAQRSSLHELHLSAGQAVVFLACLVAFVMVAWFL